MSSNTPTKTLPSSPDRRRAVAVAGTVGALAAAATALPRLRPEPAAATADAASESTSGGYRETAHVLRYYQTTRV